MVTGLFFRFKEKRKKTCVQGSVVKYAIVPNSMALNDYLFFYHATT